MVIRVVFRVIFVFFTFVILFGIVAGHIGADRKLALHTLKKYVVPAESGMTAQIHDAGEALRARVDQEYVLYNREGIDLHGYLIRAAKDSDAYVFCSHSYRSRQAAFEYGEIAPIWLAQGYNVFLVDHRAHGKSGGMFLSFGQYESEDCIEWLYFMRETFGENIRIALQGQSMGASTVLMMSGKETLPDNVKCIVSDSAYTDFYTQLWHMLPLPKWLRTPTLWPMDRYLGIVHKIHMKEADALSAVRKARVPILFLHGEKDIFVPMWMNEELFDACSSRKERVVIPDATHIKSSAYHPQLYAAEITRFVGQYL